MRHSRVALVACLLTVPAAASAADRATWTLSANAGISLGDQTEPSLGWWGALHRWVTPAAGLGLEAGRHRWEGHGRLAYAVPHGIDVSDFPDFRSLARGGQELQHLSGSLRFRGLGRTSAPCFTLSFGAYRQVIRDSGLPPATRDPRDGRLRPGWSMALGGAGTSGIAPGAEFRFDWVDTRPGPSAYFTAAFGLHLNR